MSLATRVNDLATTVATTVKGKLDKVILQNGLTHRRPVFNWYNATASSPDQIVVVTNLPFTGTMAKYRISLATIASGHLEGTLSLYHYSNAGGTIYSPRWIVTGDLDVTLKLAKSAANTLVLIFDRVGNWEYPGLVIQDAEIRYSYTFTDADFSGWTASLVSDATVTTTYGATMVTPATRKVVQELDAKEATIAAGTTGQYYRGDKTWQTLDKTAAGLGNVDNTSDVNKPVSTATQTALNGKAASAHQHVVADIPTAAVPTQAEAEAGTATTARFFTAERIKQAILALAPVKSVAGKTGIVALVKGDVGLGNVDNTADTAKPVSTAQQTALNLKSDTTHTHTLAALGIAVGQVRTPTQTNGSGDVVVTHGLGVVPTSIQVTGAVSNRRFYQTVARTTTTFTVRVALVDGTVEATANANFDWTAYA